ncbi:EF-hand domain-containing protein [Candidatus Saganbacteria bacterium]|nr:EF-hand domain-containing protein [Candidatus Saganbacteria bacterium]
MDMKISGEALSRKWINGIFSKVDTNADGEINKSEFLDALSKIMAEKTTGKNDATSKIDVDKLFSEIDQDGDGIISKDEFTQFDEEKKKVPPPMPFGFNLLDLLLSSSDSDKFSEIDTNGDGVISQDEFVKYIEKQKEALQTNLQTMFVGASVDNDVVAGTADTDTALSGDSAVSIV